jgi:hypothetical protein
MSPDPFGTGNSGAEPAGPWRRGRGVLVGVLALKTVVLFAVLYLTLDLSSDTNLRVYKALVTPLYFFEFTFVGAILTIVAFSKVTVKITRTPPAS